MWNLVYSNPICHKRKIAQEQLMHLNNIHSSKSCINNSTPWKPGHSLSKLTNKYTNTTEQEIANKNNILLSKMMEIQKKGYTYKLPPSCASLETLRKREKTKIIEENTSILKRLQSASSNYSRKYWKQDIQRIQKYRDNLQKTTKANDDFNMLAQQEQLKRASTSQSWKRQAKSSQGNRQLPYESLM